MQRASSDKAIRLLLICGMASAAAFAANAQDYFVKRDTWIETILASYEALSQQEDLAEKQSEAGRQADPALKAFDSLRIELSNKDAPRIIRVQIGGLKNVYVGSFGDELFLAQPRLVNRDGTVRPLEFGAPKNPIHGTSGHWQWDNAGERGPIKLGDQLFERWFRPHDAELTLKLDDQVQWLETTAGLLTSKENRHAQFYVDWRSAMELRKKPLEARTRIWRMAAAAFPGQQSLREQRLEELAGIWKSDWKSLAELAGRYAAGAEGSLRKQAEERAKACQSVADLQAVRDLFYVRYLKPRLELARKTLEFVEQSAKRPELAAELTDLEKQFPEAQQGKVPGEALYQKACELRRRIALSHPLLDFPKLLINKRSGHLPEHMCDQYLGRHSQAAPGLVVLENWKDHPKQNILLEGKLPKGGLLHPDLSYDGKRVLFAFADHTSPRAGNLRGYYIYEYDLESSKVRQITGTARDPLEGRDGRETVLIEDFDPCYLPDGGLAFMSTRSQQYGRCHGGRYVPSYTMYRAELDGSGIKPLSFNESNEWAPSVLYDGTIVYCRWDYVNRHDTIFQSLWTIRPDGTQTAHYYGNNSRSPCMISEPQQIPGTAKTVCTAAAHHGQTMGTIIIVDPDRGWDGGAPLTWVTPELGFPESGIPEGITRSANPLPEDSSNGRASTPWPLSENMFLCTYQLAPEQGSEYGIYLIDTLGGRELIYCDPSISCFDPIPLRPRAMPPVIASELAGKDKEKTGVFMVQNVYESTQPLAPGSIKQMRVNQIISQPTSSVPQRSKADNELVKKVLGTVPVNDDGSVSFEAPASTPLQFQLLDADGLAVLTMRSLVYVQPGERSTCVGCHEPRSSAPPQPHISTAFASSSAQSVIHPIKPAVGLQYEGGLSFVRSVQPVLDRYCICCHGLEKTEGKLDLTGTFGGTVKDGGKERHRSSADFSVAYQSLINAPNMVKVAPRNGETVFSKPKDYFAHAGKLARLLLDGHPGKDGKKRVELDRESFTRIAEWLDLNAQFYGDYSHNRIENQSPVPDGETALRAAIEKRFGPELAKQPYAALVNQANVAESRILMAPLPASAGGWGQIANGAYSSKDDPAYAEMRRLAEASVASLKYHDVAGTCGHTKDCRCGNCWVRQDLEARRTGALNTPTRR
ncbi:MAG TPA: hypothetical protein VGP72_32680 [Planctomycetota bacterium]|jgi:hypothetical protein